MVRTLVATTKLNTFGFVVATEVGPFGDETSCSQNKCTMCIMLKNHSPFDQQPLRWAAHMLLVQFPPPMLPLSPSLPLQSTATSLSLSTPGAM